MRMTCASTRRHWRRKMPDLPPLPSGVYRHYKGPLYQVLGYAHDANADELYSNRSGVARSESQAPSGDRIVVVYFGLQLEDAHMGPRLAVRTVDDFFAWVHNDGHQCPAHNSDVIVRNNGGRCSDGFYIRKRFEFLDNQLTRAMFR